MTELHVLRVFVGPDGAAATRSASSSTAPRSRPSAPGGRRATRLLRDGVRRRRGGGRDPDLHAGRELPFAGHPTVGTAWLFRETGAPGDDLRPPAGEVAVPARRRADLDPRPPEWVASDPRRAARDAPPTSSARPGQAMGEPASTSGPGSTRPPGTIRARYFADRRRDPEDEATGAAAVVHGRAARPADDDPPGRRVGDPRPARSRDGTVEIGGRVELVETREYSGG